MSLFIVVVREGFSQLILILLSEARHIAVVREGLSQLIVMLDLSEIRRTTF